ncbi:MAG: SagB/ThcOx family dehydrogenase [Eubacteriales bacterium]|nr:SagB/ThcOx family dehydrogenase [Eubacteriales bacterium]
MKIDNQAKIKAMREFLRDTIRLNTDFKLTDRAQGIAQPAIEKAVLEAQELISLPDPSKTELAPLDLRALLERRRSVRSYAEEALSLTELSWLLYATQGVSKQTTQHNVFRTVPSAGNRHPFETYVAVQRVTGLSQGIYRYLPLEHALVFESELKDYESELTAAALGQRFAGKAAVNFIWTAIPYRTEWSYGPVSVKVIAMDLGHICQNLYLAVESIACGTCEIGAYHQELADRLLKVDGQDEFVVAMAPLGKLKQ